MKLDLFCVPNRIIETLEEEWRIKFDNTKRKIEKRSTLLIKKKVVNLWRREKEKYTEFERLKLEQNTNFEDEKELID